MNPRSEGLLAVMSRRLPKPSFLVYRFGFSNRAKKSSNNES